MDKFVAGHPGGRGTNVESHEIRGRDLERAPLESVREPNDEEEEEECGTARNMGLRLSAVRGAGLTDAGMNLDYVSGKQTPPFAADTSKDEVVSPQLMSSKMQLADDILRKRRKHVFVLTSASKPVFTRYGDEGDLSDLFGVFQVIMAMAEKRHTNATVVQKGKREMLHYITAGDMAMYFHVDGELFSVLVTRTGESMRSCMRQLRQFHLQILSLVPNASSILLRCPSYDLRQLISYTDSSVLRQLIKRNSHEESYLFRCIAAAPLSVKWRRSLESLLARHHATRLSTTTSGAFDRTEEGVNVQTYESTAGEAAAAHHHLWSFFFFRGRVVSAVGSTDSDAPLHIDDALILLNFTRFLAHSQSGEIWAPLCLPKYNNTGYLWCYCANMSVMAREQKQLRQRRLRDENSDKKEEKEERRCESTTCMDQSGAKKSSSPLYSLVDVTPAAYAKSEGLLLVHIAASQEAFAVLAEQSCRVARQLMLEIAELEEELSHRENVPLSFFTSEGRTCDSGREAVLSARDDEASPFVAPLLNPRDVFTNPTSSAFIHPDGLQWFAAVMKGKSVREGISSNLIYSEPSPGMRFSPKERKRLLRLVVKQRDELMQCARVSEPLLLVRMNDVSILVMRTAPAFITSLLDQFHPTVSSNSSSPQAMSGGGGGGEKTISTQDVLFASHRVKELMLLFFPHVANPQMIRCALRLLVQLVARERELTFQQAERRHAIAATAAAERKRDLKRMRGDTKNEKNGAKEKSAKFVKRHAADSEEERLVDPLVLSAEDPSSVLRTIGDHVNTRLREIEFDDDIDADLFDEKQRQLREEAQLAAGTKSRVLSPQITTFLHRQHLPQASAHVHDDSDAIAAGVKMVRIGHNSNAVTAVCGLGCELVALGDKSGSVYVAELFGGPSPSSSSSSSSSQKMLLSPCLPAAVLSIAVSDTRGVRPSQRSLFERSTVDTSVTSYIAAGAADGTVSVWVTSTRKHMGFLKMHRSAVTGLTFRLDTLYSCSSDETLRVWSVPQMICQDKLFGHQGRVLGIHCLRRERCATVGEDGTMRFWKVDAATQQEFTTSSHFGVKVVLECVCMINDNLVFCGASNGALLLFDVNRRKPLAVREAAHGYGFVGDGTGLEKEAVMVAAQLERATTTNNNNGDNSKEQKEKDYSRKNANPITAVACIPYADVAASASYDGAVRLWRIVTPDNPSPRFAGKTDKSETVGTTTTTFESLASIPIDAIVTSLYFSSGGDALIIGCGKEPRLGRWVVLKRALNAAYVVPLDDTRLQEFASCTQVEHIPALLYGFDDEENEENEEDENNNDNNNNNNFFGGTRMLGSDGVDEVNSQSEGGSDDGNDMFTLGEDGQMQFSVPMEKDLTDEGGAARKKKKGLKSKKESNPPSRVAHAKKDRKKKSQVKKEEKEQPADDSQQPQRNKNNKKKKSMFKLAKE